MPFSRNLLRNNRCEYVTLEGAAPSAPSRQVQPNGKLTSAPGSNDSPHSRRRQRGALQKNTQFAIVLPVSARLKGGIRFMERGCWTIMTAARRGLMGAPQSIKPFHFAPTQKRCFSPRRSRRLETGTGEAIMRSPMSIWERTSNLPSTRATKITPSSRIA